MKKRLLTGDRPTGKLHLGHYVGSLKNRVRMQYDYETFLMVADIQALTDNFDNPEKVRTNVLEVAMDNLAVGIDPKISTMFIQSMIPEIAELTVLYSNLVTVSELQRNPTVKTEIGDKGHIFKNGNVTFGFLGYPVSQAADITTFRAEVVPVGADQAPMIEQTTKLVRRFNHYYNGGYYFEDIPTKSGLHKKSKGHLDVVFPEPEGIYGEIPRLSGLDGRKMSKSFGNAIYLADSREEVLSKIKKAKTDSDTENLIRFDEKAKPEVSNLMQYYHIATGKNMNEIEAEFAGLMSYKNFKDALGVALNEFLDPIRERRSKYEANPDLVWEILKKGTQKARQEAAQTMALVREKMKIDY